MEKEKMNALRDLLSEVIEFGPIRCAGDGALRQDLLFNGERVGVLSGENGTQESGEIWMEEFHLLDSCQLFELAAQVLLRL